MLFLQFSPAICNFDRKKREIILFLFLLSNKSLFQCYIGEKILFFSCPKQNNQSGFSDMGDSANVFMYAVSTV